jgi:hypothetical protein
MKWLVLLLLLPSGCASVPQQRAWCVRYTPVTNAERQRVSLEVRAILGAQRASVDTREAYRVACEMWCHPTMWEWSQNQYGWTGQWREIR